MSSLDDFQTLSDRLSELGQIIEDAMLSEIKDMVVEDAGFVIDLWKGLGVLMSDIWLVAKDIATFLMRLVIFFALCITSPAWVWFYLARRNK